MTSSEFALLLLQLGVMLGAATLLGSLARRFGQPAIVGEMAAGILVGVTVLGVVLPGAYDWLFHSSADVTVVRDAAVKLGMLFFLFVAGSEIDLGDVRRLGRQGLVIGLVGTLVPIAAGVALVYVTPMSFWGEPVGIGRLPFALFVGINLANSANPVLAKILMELGLMRTRIGSVMMTATVVDDLVNWSLYGLILGSMSAGASSGGPPLGLRVLGVMAAIVGILVVGRKVAPALVAFSQRHMSDTVGYVTVASIAVLAASVITEALGVNAFLGAFLAGVAFSTVAATEGRDGHRAFSGVALGFFAPVFFASMALSTDFVANFDVALVAVLLGAALVTKLAGVLLGARLAGLPVDRRAWAIGWGLNARGATGIVLAGTGLAAGVIDQTLFVALVVMCIVTSLLAGPMMVRSLPASERVPQAAPRAGGLVPGGEDA